MHLLIDNEIMQNEESHNHMESEMSIVIEALLQTREKLFEATRLNIFAQIEQKVLHDRKHNPNCGHTPSVPDPRVTLGPWLAQVHTYPVGTWNSSESASKCFATHKNGTHLH